MLELVEEEEVVVQLQKEEVEVEMMVNGGDVGRCSNSKSRGDVSGGGSVNDGINGCGVGALVEMVMLGRWC